MKGQSIRDASRINFVQRGESAIQEEVLMGCQQRIADAVEAIAADHEKLKADLERAKDSANYWRRKALDGYRRIAALRGVITKLKRKVAPS